MKITSQLYESIRSVPIEDWNRVDTCPNDPFMRPAFLQGVEDSFDDLASFWYLLLRDEHQSPQASCCMSLYEIDGCLMAGTAARSIVEGIRRLFSKFLKLRVLLVGLPFSAGQSHVRINDGAPTETVLDEIESQAELLAKQTNAHLIVYKEFNQEQQEQLQYLEELGYVGASSVPSHSIPAHFGNFQEFLAAMRDKYRRKIKSSMKRFSKNDFEIKHFTGLDDINSIYSEAVHQLYLGVVEHSETTLEILPRETLPSLAKNFESNFLMTVVYDEAKPIAFASGIYQGSAYYPLLGGVNYELNRKTELYFNLVYVHFRQAMGRPLTWIHFGASADEFKLRLGAQQQARYYYVRARGIISRPFKLLQKSFLQENKMREPYRVFKVEEEQNSNSSHNKTAVSQAV